MPAYKRKQLIFLFTWFSTEYLIPVKARDFARIEDNHPYDTHEKWERLNGTGRQLSNNNEKKSKSSKSKKTAKKQGAKTAKKVKFEVEDTLHGSQSYAFEIPAGSIQTDSNRLEIGYSFERTIEPTFNLEIEGTQSSSLQGNFLDETSQATTTSAGRIDALRRIPRFSPSNDIPAESSLLISSTQTISSDSSISFQHWNEATDLPLSPSQLLPINGSIFDINDIQFPYVDVSPQPSHSPTRVELVVPSGSFDGIVSFSNENQNLGSKLPTDEPTSQGLMSNGIESSQSFGLQEPSSSPSVIPSDYPSVVPTGRPSVQPSSKPTESSIFEASLSVIPSDMPSELPTLQPDSQPSVTRSHISWERSSFFQDLSTIYPSVVPNIAPSSLPSISPSTLPSHTRRLVQSTIATKDQNPISQSSGTAGDNSPIQVSSNPSRNLPSQPSTQNDSESPQEPSHLPSTYPTGVASDLRQASLPSDILSSLTQSLTEPSSLFSSPPSVSFDFSTRLDAESDTRLSSQPSAQNVSLQSVSASISDGSSKVRGEHRAKFSIKNGMFEAPTKADPQIHFIGSSSTRDQNEKIFQPEQSFGLDSVDVDKKPNTSPDDSLRKDLLDDISMLSSSAPSTSLQSKMPSIAPSHESAYRNEHKRSYLRGRTKGRNYQSR